MDMPVWKTVFIKVANLVFTLKHIMTRPNALNAHPKMMGGSATEYIPHAKLALIAAPITQAACIKKW